MPCAVMLRYKADRQTLLFVAIYFSLLIGAWQHGAAGLWAKVAWILPLCLFSFLGAVATHNALHSPPFKARWANRVFQVILTLTYGHPVSAYVPGHNLSHHRHTQSRKAVMRTTK